MEYRAIPIFRAHLLRRVRRVLNPRWFLATRIEYVRFGELPGYQRYEAGAGYRPNRLQSAKLSYGIEQGKGGSTSGVVTFQLVTSLNRFAVSR
jgi:hypothetical protein